MSSLVVVERSQLVIVEDNGEMNYNMQHFSHRKASYDIIYF